MRWLRHSLIHSDSCRVWSSVWGFGCWDGTLPLVCPTKSPGPLKNSFTATDVFTSKDNGNTQRKQTQDHTCLCMRLYRCPFVSVPWKKTLWLPVWDLCAFVVWCYGRGTVWSKILVTGKFPRMVGMKDLECLSVFGQWRVWALTSAKLGV